MCNEEYISLFPAALVDCISVKSFNYAGNSLLSRRLPSNIHLSLIYVFIILPSDAENNLQVPMLFHCVTLWTFYP